MKNTWNKKLYLKKQKKQLITEKYKIQKNFKIVSV